MSSRMSISWRARPRRRYSGATVKAVTCPCQFSPWPSAFPMTEIKKSLSFVHQLNYCYIKRLETFSHFFSLRSFSNFTQNWNLLMNLVHLATITDRRKHLQHTQSSVYLQSTNLQFMHLHTSLLKGVHDSSGFFSKLLGIQCWNFQGTLPLNDNDKYIQILLKLVKK